MKVRFHPLTADGADIFQPLICGRQRELRFYHCSTATPCGGLYPKPIMGSYNENVSILFLCNRSRSGDWAGWKPVPQGVPPHFGVRQNRPNYGPSAWP